MNAVDYNRTTRPEPSVWWDNYMKITYAMLGAAVIPVVVALVGFFFV